MGAYTRQDLEEIDAALYSMMRAKSVQEVLDIMISPDPPRNRLEYLEALTVFNQRILDCQPNALDSSDKDALRISPYCPYPPLALIGHWARAAALYIAVENYEGGAGAVIGVLDTACQYGDDNLLLSGAKLGFGVVCLLIPIRSQADLLSKLVGIALKILLSEDEECARRHSLQTRHLCAGFFSMLGDFAMMHTSSVRMTKTGMAFLHQKLRIEAEEIDKATRNRFRAKDWVDEQVKRLGYSTGLAHFA